MRNRVLIVSIWAMVLALVPLTMQGGGSGEKGRAVHPNPFTEGTTFQLTMRSEAQIRVAVYDMLGKHIRTLIDRIHPAGEFDVPWDGNDEYGQPVPPGVYFGVLVSEGVTVRSVKVIKVPA